MDLVKDIEKAVLRNVSVEDRRYIGASSIGKECSRAIWYGISSIKGDDLPSKCSITFEIGRRLEGLLADYVALAGYQIERPSESNNWLFVHDNEISLFQGHMDGVINGNAVLEFKTANNSSFSKFRQHGLKAWSASYYAQLQAYMGMSSFNSGVLLALNKDTSELHHEWVTFDEIFYSELKMKALAIASVGEPPERINKSPLFYICNRCNFKTICHGGE